MSETVDLGGGSVLKLNDLSGLADLPAVKAALRAKANQAAAYANSIGVTEPPNDGTPLYRVLTRNGNVGVAPDDYRGVVDDAYHSTLLKTQAHEQDLR